MSNNENKKRFSARVKTETLDEIEEYQHANGLDNRSEAIEHLVEYREKVERSSDLWGEIAQTALFGVTFSLLVSLISTAAFVVLYTTASFPSPMTLIAFSVLMGGLLGAVTSGLGYAYSTSRANRHAAEVEA
jgi:hypothetical protein